MPEKFYGLSNDNANVIALKQKRRKKKTQR